MKLNNILRGGRIMKKGTLILMSSLVIGSMAFSAMADAISWTWTDDNYVHTYEVYQGDLTWDQAKAEVKSDWHLATITSQEEQQTLFDAMMDASAAGDEYWLGATQAPQTDEERIADPDAGWSWELDNFGNQEEWNYTNWAVGEPNEWNGTLENHLGIRKGADNESFTGWAWNDEHGSSNIRGYVVEKETPVSVPEPSVISLLAMGIFCLGLYGRKKRK
ncbi:MAG: PEP-CTERM sorting domain-containing protein [Chitinivibrionales bacterium]|nr:PEP-CTERM sorting domain-containing protein [Chitinivibrionales bacterium]